MPISTPRPVVLSKTILSLFSADYLLRFLTTITTAAAPAARTAITAIAIQIPTEALSRAARVFHC